jgi:hypothetical protein
LELQEGRGVLFIGAPRLGLDVPATGSGRRAGVKLRFESEAATLAGAKTGQRVRGTGSRESSAC